MNAHWMGQTQNFRVWFLCETKSVLSYLSFKLSRRHVSTPVAGRVFSNSNMLFREAVSNNLICHLGIKKCC